MIKTEYPRIEESLRNKIFWKIYEQLRSGNPDYANSVSQIMRDFGLINGTQSDSEALKNSYAKDIMNLVTKARNKLGKELNKEISRTEVREERKFIKSLSAKEVRRLEDELPEYMKELFY